MDAVTGVASTHAAPAHASAKGLTTNRKGRSEERPFLSYNLSLERQNSPVNAAVLRYPEGVRKIAVGRGIWIAAILGLCWIIGLGALGSAFVRGRSGDDIIRVVGSARKPIRSDFIIWSGQIARTAPQIGTAYTQLRGDLAKVQAYLAAKGIDRKEMFPQAITTRTLYKRAPGETDASINDPSILRQVAGYQLSQSIEVRSTKVDLLDDLSRQASELIGQGVTFEPAAPRFLYTKLSDLKVSMQAEAAKDARQRAQSIAEAAGATLGEVRWARMTAPSITPQYSNSDDDGGVDDTSSLEKKITAIVTVGYAVK